MPNITMTKERAALYRRQRAEARRDSLTEPQIAAATAAVEAAGLMAKGISSAGRSYVSVTSAGNLGAVGYIAREHGRYVVVDHSDPANVRTLARVGRFEDALAEVPSLAA